MKSTACAGESFASSAKSSSVYLLTGRATRDATTPTHDFLIAPHPHSEGLFLATGGSFHGWKFLPVIGDYIVAMMEGTLEAEYAARWAWDKKDGSGRCANPTYDIAFDLAESEWLE